MNARQIDPIGVKGLIVLVFLFILFMVDPVCKGLSAVEKKEIYPGGELR